MAVGWSSNLCCSWVRAPSSEKKDSLRVRFMADQN